MFLQKNLAYCALLLTCGILCLTFTTLEGAAKEDPHVKIVKQDGSDLSILTLTAKAAERLDIKTAKVKQEEDNDSNDDREERHRERSKERDKIKAVIPYSALIYDEKGNTWVYTNPQPLTYVRHRVVVDDYEDNEIVLRSGPPIGSEVVVIGASELYGAEKGIGK